MTLPLKGQTLSEGQATLLYQEFCRGTSHLPKPSVINHGPRVIFTHSHKKAIGFNQTLSHLEMCTNQTSVI